MSDEIYRCNQCGATNEGCYYKYKVTEELSQEDLEKIEKALGRELEVEEITRCSECEQEAEFFCVGSTEDR